MSCGDIYITVNPDPNINITVNPDPNINITLSGGVGGETLIDQTNHTVSNASVLEYLLKNGQAFKPNTLLVFRNGILQKKYLHYEENGTNTGIIFLITLDDDPGDKDDITQYYAVA